MVTSDALDWVSVTSADLLLSIRMPRGWHVQAVDETHFQLISDVDDGGYRANVLFTEGHPEEQGVAWFSAFCEAVPGQLAEALEDYEQIDTEEFWLSSRARVFEVRYRQHADGAPPTSHVQAYVWVDSYRMYVLDAGTLRGQESRDLPVFDGILRAVRVLPRHPDHET